MSILSIVSILGLIAVSVVVLSDKICTTDIAVSLIELVVDNVRNDLLAAVPDMIYTLTVNSFLITQAACIVLVACCRIAVGKADKLIQTVVLVSLSFAVGNFFNLIAVSVISVNCLLYIVLKLERSLIFNSFYFLLKQSRILALSVIIIVFSYIIFRTGCCHFGTVAVIVILI